MTNLDKIAELFPECITEARDDNGNLQRAIDFDVLKNILSENISKDAEHYSFSWVGKNAALNLAYKKINSTLRPCKADSLHWDTTQNLYIEGDNLDVLKVLLESYLGKVKMIYIDPPYNTGNDFIYRDNFSMDAEQLAAQINLFDDDGNKNFKLNSNSNPRFHSDWCSMIFSRLIVARNFLADDGVIFISIDDNEQANLKKICDDVFGENNFVATIHWRRSESQNNNAKLISNVSEYIFCYLKVKTFLSSFNKLKLTSKALKEYRYEDNKGPFRRGTISDNTRGNYLIEVVAPNGLKKTIKSIRTKEFIDEQNAKGMIYWTSGGIPYLKIYLNSDAGQIANNWFDDSGVNEDASEMLSNMGISFDYSKPVELIKRFLQITTDEESIVMDFFSGSATTAHAVMALNADDGGRRKFIMVQLPEPCAEKTEAYKAGYKNICEIGKERIRRAGEKIKADAPLTTLDLDVGFRVFKLDSTNMRDVSITPAEFTKEKLLDLAENIKADRTDLDLLFEHLLKCGVEISKPYTEEKIDGYTVHNYNSGEFMACFDENISRKVVEYIAKKKPFRAVFRDHCFITSPDKINAKEIFKYYAPNTDFKVI